MRLQLLRLIASLAFATTAWSQANQAVDAVPALGKQDLESAQLQIKTCLAELATGVGKYQQREDSLSPPPTAERVQARVKETLASRPGSAESAYRQNLYDSASTVVISYALPDSPPNKANIGRATRLLDLYYNFSRTHPDAIQNQAWEATGIDALTAASQVLQNFHFVPESQVPVAAELSALRAKTRLVAELFCKSPAVRDGYFVGTRIARQDELARSIGGAGSIYACKVKWGVYWQETPEDCLVLYRELMNSAAFSYIHTDLWLREVQNPRLVAWNQTDRRRAPMVWNRFVQALAASTNVLWQLEARAIAVADSTNEVQLTTSFTNFFNGMFANRDALVANNVEVLYLNWGADKLVSAKTGGSVTSSTTERLKRLFASDYRPRLEAMGRSYRDRTILEEQAPGALQEQKKSVANK